SRGSAPAPRLDRNVSSSRRRSLRLGSGEPVKSPPMFVSCWCVLFSSRPGSGCPQGSPPSESAVKVEPRSPPGLRDGGRGAASPTRATLLLSPLPMLYQVKLQYGFVIDAASRDEAYTKALRLVRENPASYIADVRQHGEPKGNPSLMKRLITGR